MALTDRRVVLVRQDGSVRPGGILADATVGDVEWSVGSEPCRWSFTVPVDSDSASAVLAERFIEAQVWRDDDLLSWGPIVDLTVDRDRLLRCDGYDCLWYLDRRQIGPDVRTNLVDNGDWSSGLTSWTTRITASSYSWGASGASAKAESSTHPITGIPTCKVTDLTDLAPTDETRVVVWQELTVKQPADTSPGGIHAGAFPRDMTVTVNAYIPSADWLGPNDGEVGVRIARYPEDWDDGATDPFNGDENAYALQMASGEAPIRADIEKDKDVPLQATVSIPAAWGGRVLVQLWGPRGVVHWGPVLVDLDDGLEYAGEDQAEIARKTIDQVSGNPAVVGFPGDLPYYDAGSDLSLSVSSSATGVTRNKRWMYAQRQSALRALQELAAYDDGVEIAMSYPDSSTRQVDVNYPRTGQARTDVIFRVDDTHSNVETATWSWKGDDAASSVIVLGPGGNLSRIEGGASDTSGWADGVTLPAVVQARLDDPVASDVLNTIAATQLDLAADPVDMTVRVDAGKWWGRFDVGDRVRVQWTAGHARHAGVMRIEKLRLTSDDWFDLTLTPWPSGWGA
jgi:hypothetical protein